MEVKDPIGWGRHPNAFTRRKKKGASNSTFSFFPTNLGCLARRPYGQPFTESMGSNVANGIFRHAENR